MEMINNESEEPMNSVDRLRDARRQYATVDDGTVVRWRGGGGSYTYAAVFVAGFWYLTGSTGFYGSERLSNQRFTERVLASGKDIEVATGWQTV